MVYKSERWISSKILMSLYYFQIDSDLCCNHYTATKYYISNKIIGGIMKIINGI